MNQFKNGGTDQTIDGRSQSQSQEVETKQESVLKNKSKTKNNPFTFSNVLTYLKKGSIKLVFAFVLQAIQKFPLLPTILIVKLYNYEKQRKAHVLTLLKFIFHPLAFFRLFKKQLSARLMRLFIRFSAPMDFKFLMLLLYFIYTEYKKWRKGQRNFLSFRKFLLLKLLAYQMNLVQEKILNNSLLNITSRKYISN